MEAAGSGIRIGIALGHSSQSLTSDAIAVCVQPVLISIWSTGRFVEVLRALPLLEAAVSEQRVPSVVSVGYSRVRRRGSSRFEVAPQHHFRDRKCRLTETQTE